MTRRSFNTSIEGQPLQQDKNGQKKSITEVSIPLSRDSLCNIRIPKSKPCSKRVSIPLSRDSLCNTMAVAVQDVSDCFNPSIEGQPLQQVTKELSCLNHIQCFNPSIEGQPLQLKYTLAEFRLISLFQSLYRGTAFATHHAPLGIKDVSKFQSLYRGTAFATQVTDLQMLSSKRFQSLYRGTAFATYSMPS